MKKQIFIGLSITLVGLIILNIFLGSVNIPFSEFWNLIFDGETSKKAWDIIILDYRIPKTITAITVGIGLSVAGLLMQTFFQNPLAGPFTLGISSGASLGVALIIMLEVISVKFLSVGGFLNNSYMIVAAAILGSSLVLLLVVFTAAKIKDNVSLLIVGLMFGSFTGAIVYILQSFSSSENIKSFVVWTFGSLTSVSWSELAYLVPLVLIGVVVAFMHQKVLNTMLLGENYVKTLGFSIKKIRLILILITGLIAGVITAFTGPIAFIGVAVPHITRFIFKTSNHGTLLLGTTIIGASLMLFCDTVAQLPGLDQILPINAVTSLLGAPVVVWVILRSNRI